VFVERHHRFRWIPVPLAAGKHSDITTKCFHLATPTLLPDQAAHQSERYLSLTTLHHSSPPAELFGRLQIRPAQATFLLAALSTDQAWLTRNQCPRYDYPGRALSSTPPKYVLSVFRHLAAYLTPQS
jgi:hypothetical protein